MATNIRLQSVVVKTSIQPFSKPRAHRQPSKVETLEDYLSDMNDQERLTFELERFGHFTVEEGDRWTQTEIDAEWARLNASKLTEASTERSPAFTLNWNFKPEPEPKYIVLDDDQPAPVPVKPLMPVAKETPVNYWDDWRAREAKEERQKEAERLLKKRKSDEDWGKYFYFYFKN